MTELSQHANERKVIGGNNADVQSRLDRRACFLPSDEVDWPDVVADAAWHGCATEKVGEANQMIPFWGVTACSLFLVLLSRIGNVCVTSIGCHGSKEGNRRSFVSAWLMIGR